MCDRMQPVASSIPRSNIATLSKLTAVADGNAGNREEAQILDLITEYKWLQPNASMITVKITMRERIFCEALAETLSLDQAKAAAGYDDEFDLDGILNVGGAAFLNRLLHQRLDAESMTDWKVVSEANEAIDRARKSGNITAMVQAVKLLAQMRGMLVMEQEAPKPTGMPMIRAGARPGVKSGQ